MRLKAIYGFVVCLVGVLFSCTEHKQGDATAVDPVAGRIEQLQGIPMTADNGDSLTQAWKKLLHEQDVNARNLYAAQVNYQLARRYAMAGQNDSAAVYLEIAFERIEAEPGNWEEKARIYQGIGNLNLAEGHLHRANYYYNKAAAIVLADSAVQLEPTAKTAILLAAAQSNQQFHRYELALEMNRRALALSDQLPPGHINRQRPLTQLIQTGYHSKIAVDSVRYYVAKLEEMHRQFPNTYDMFFVYEGKALYYDLKREVDSVLNYQLRKTDLQEKAVEKNRSGNAAINNLFISYVNIAGLYTEKRQLTHAQHYFEKADQLTGQHRTVISYDHLIVYHKNREDFYTVSGRLRQALAEAHEVARIQEALYARQNTQAIAEMNSVYEIQARERSILQLNEHLRLKELELQENRLGLMVSILFALLLILTLVFIYYGFRQRRIRQEKDQVILQQQLLRTQMEPHFIFNTLTALQHYIRQGRSDEAINYLSRFSKLLRNSLEISREQWVTLEQEIETLEHYLMLQQMRFENAFSYRLRFNGDIEAAIIRLPPMLIQPFVENALLHGVDMKSGDGCIGIDFSECNDLLRVDITDSGRRQKQAGASEGHRSLSGMISRERLALLGRDARVETRKNEAGGTTVTLYIPVS